MLAENKRRWSTEADAMGRCDRPLGRHEGCRASAKVATITERRNPRVDSCSRFNSTDDPSCLFNAALGAAGCPRTTGQRRCDCCCCKYFKRKSSLCNQFEMLFDLRCCKPGGSNPCSCFVVSQPQFPEIQGGRTWLQLSKGPN